MSLYTVPDELTDVLVSTPDTLSGAVRFTDTRVPVQALLDTLAHGESLSDFLEGFPDVAPDQALKFVAWQQNQTRRILGLELAG